MTVRFFLELWRSARRPAIFSRCALIAAIVGTTLTAINLGDAISQGPIDLGMGFKIAANFVVPFIVSNLGAMSSMPSAR